MSSNVEDQSEGFSQVKHPQNFGKSLKEDDLCQITDFHVEDLPKDSPFVRPFRAKFTDQRNGNPAQRAWDAIDGHNSVAIIVYNKSNDSIVIVRQFRPAIHVMVTKEAQNVKSIHQIDFTKQNAKSAITYEFCAGIIDKKDLSNRGHAHMELLEECGFEVDIDSIESVATYRTGVGTNGAMQELFYVEVTNEMKKTTGGGNISEQELIAVEEIPVDQLYSLLFDSTKPKETTFMFGIMWFLHRKSRLPRVIAND